VIWKELYHLCYLATQLGSTFILGDKVTRSHVIMCQTVAYILISMQILLMDHMLGLSQR
jgi:hypothetical protein